MLIDIQKQIVEDFIKAMDVHDTLTVQYHLKLLNPDTYKTAIKELWTEFIKEVVDLHERPGEHCPYKPDARCTKPDDISCSEIDCEVWVKYVLGGYHEGLSQEEIKELTDQLNKEFPTFRRGLRVGPPTEKDLQIADRLKDYWKCQGNED
jgi:hypothetical protein